MRKQHEVGTDLEIEKAAELYKVCIDFIRPALLPDDKGAYTDASVINTYAPLHCSRLNFSNDTGHNIKPIIIINQGNSHHWYNVFPQDKISDLQTQVQNSMLKDQFDFNYVVS